MCAATYAGGSGIGDMLQILYRMPPEDISIMTAILNKYSESYTVQFNIANTKCPACGHVNENNILTTLQSKLGAYLRD